MFIHRLALTQKIQLIDVQSMGTGVEVEIESRRFDIKKRGPIWSASRPILVREPMLAPRRKQTTGGGGHRCRPGALCCSD